MGMIFISHSSRDNVKAIQIRNWLRKNGWPEVFLDLDPSQGLAPGHRWQAELKRAGEQCVAVFVLLSPSWVASRWCQTEFLLADQLGKLIFPVLIEPTPFGDLPIELQAKFQIADVSLPEREADGFHRLDIGLKRAGLDPTSFEWPPAHEPTRSVYRGLQVLDVQDAAIFFGRNAAITKGLDELRRLRDGAPERALIVLGASGAGKSSFLRAGLIARLKRYEEIFLVLPIIRPERAAVTGAQGLIASLTRATGLPSELSSGPEAVVKMFAAAREPVLARFTRYSLAAGEVYTGRPPTIVLAVDQAEELIRADNAEGGEFLHLLTGALKLDENALAIFTVRSDSYAALQKDLRFTSLPHSLFSLPPLSLGAYKDVIEGPAHLAKPPLCVQPELSDALLEDLVTDDALPLLALTLERLQRHCDPNGNLTLATYRDDLGGIGGAVRGAVEAVLGQTPDADLLALVRRIFIPALVRLDQDGVTRRVARRSDFSVEALPILNRFVDQRLLVSDVNIYDEGGIETVEIAHEAVLRLWPALAIWIAEEEDALRALRALRFAAEEWQKRKARRDLWLVHRGDQLNTAITISRREEFITSIDQDMHNYIRECQKQEARMTARRRAFQGLVVALAAPLLVIGSITIWQSKLLPIFAAYTKYRPYTNSNEVLTDGKRQKTFQDCRRGSNDCPVMVMIPGGTFLMGSAEDSKNYDESSQGSDSFIDVEDKELRLERPQHQVKVRIFAVSEFDITFSEWQSCVESGGCKGNPNPADAGWGRGNRPVIGISWYDAQSYVDWLSKMTGVSYELLTEAQWEYAARAGSKTEFWWGNTITTYNANYDGNYSYNGGSKGILRNETTPVGTYAPNSFGLYDMAGNVWQFVQDCEHDNYFGAPRDGSAWNSGSNCFYRVLRGGAWDTEPFQLRSSTRNIWGYPASASSDIGFRVARIF